ncbi:hypothetical protein SteCoe_22588 [Stentor coeruleus]|uniref:Polycystin cation channel PKD1/PKD2 domain-containing protein n=1 Tax=Stentor coeruleus TaxID=5963 RepID=A0A1R2BLX2_9CILI|nr:hypothetical protein SteCoe_22588 [Stentor coeruleus]
MEKNYDDNPNYTVDGNNTMFGQSTDFGFSQSTHLSSERYLERLRKPELTAEDMMEIDKKLKECEKNIANSLSDTQVQDEGTFYPLVSCALLILFIIYISRVNIIAELSNVVIATFEHKKWNSEPDKFLDDITTLDDINNYIEKNLLFHSFKDDLLLDFNYVCGIRMTLKLANLIDNPYKDYNFSRYIKEESVYLPKKYNPGEDTQRQILWEYSFNSFRGYGGYTAYFMQTTYKEALFKWREMKTVYLNKETFESLVIEMVIHNSNLYSTLYYYQIFNRESSGRVAIETGLSGISPEMYDSQNSQFYEVAVILSFYFLLLAVQLLKFILSMKKILKDCLTKMTLQMTLYDYLELVLVCTVLTVLGYFLKLDLENIGNFSLPLDKHSFDLIIDYAVNFRILLRIASITCLLCVLRLVASLQVQFPSFGVLFQTIFISKNDLINLCFIGVILMLGFIAAIYLVCGITNDSYKSYDYSAIELFGSLISYMGFHKASEFNQLIRNFYFFIFVILFSFIFIRNFSAIVMSTYMFLKNRDQLLLAARAEMLKKKSTKLFKIVLNLILFRQKTSLYNDAEDYMRIKRKAEDDNTLLQPEIREKIKSLESSIKQQASISLWLRLKSNLVNLSSFLQQKSLEPKASVINKLKGQIKKILKKERKKEIIMQKKELDVDYNFAMFVEMIVFLLLLVLFSYTTMYKVNIKDTYDMRTVAKNSISLKNFTYLTEMNVDQATSYIEVEAFIDQIFFDLLKGNPYCQNFLYLNNTMRITFNRFNYHNNTAKFSKNVIPKIISSSSNKTEFRGKSSKLLYNYYNPGEDGTFRRDGGASVILKSYDQAKNIFKLISKDKVNSENCYMIALEWVSYNQNLESFTYNYIFFKQLYSGKIAHEFKSVSITPQMYITENIKSIILDCISLLLCTFFAVKIFKEFIVDWKKMNKKRIIEAKKRDKVYKVIEEISKDERKGKKTAREHATRFLESCLYLITMHFVQILRALFKYYTKELSRSIETISFLLTYITLFITFGLNVSPLKMDSFDDFYDSAEIVEVYRMLVAFNFFFLFIRFPKYFLLSSKMAFLMGIMGKAQLDFLFFLMMYFTIMVGFMFMGHIMLGHYHPGYATLGYSFMSGYFLRFGVFNFKLYNKADETLGILYIVSFVVIIIFFLSSMFVSIITGYYKTLLPNFSSKVGLISKIILTIRAKMKGEKVLMAHLQEEVIIDQVISGQSSERSVRDEKGQIDTERKTTFIENITIEQENTNDWISEVESELLSRSGGEISFPTFLLKSSKIITPEIADVKELVFVCQETWEKETCKGRVQIWNSFARMSDHLNSEKLELALEQAGVMSKKFNPLSLENKDLELQTPLKQNKFWELLPYNEKISLWMGELNEEGRHAIWVLIPYPEDLEKNWANLSIEEKFSRSQAFTKKITNHIKHFKSAKDPISYISSLDIDDKSKFWLTLTGKQRIKQQLFIRSLSTEESQIIAFIIMSENYANIITIENLDYIVERLLENQIYKKIEAASWAQAEFARSSNIKLSCEEESYNCSALLEYKNNLAQEKSRLEFVKKKLSIQISGLEKIKTDKRHQSRKSFDS